MGRKPIHLSISDCCKKQVIVCTGICKNSYFLLFSYKKQIKTFMTFTQISNTSPNSSIYGAFTWHSPLHFFPRSAYSIIHLHLLGQWIQKKGSNSSMYTFFIWTGKTGTQRSKNLSYINKLVMNIIFQQ